MEVPTKATPAGWVIGLLGTGLVGYSLFCARMFYLITVATEITGRGNLLRFYGALIVGSLVGGLWLLRLGWRRALKSGMSDPDDPGKPSVRF